jgi:hypothetical protein
MTRSESAILSKNLFNLVNVTLWNICNGN